MPVEAEVNFSQMLELDESWTVAVLSQFWHNNVAVAALSQINQEKRDFWERGIDDYNELITGKRVIMGERDQEN